MTDDKPRTRAEWEQRELPDEDRAYLLRALFGPDPEQPLILMQITPRQQEILAEVMLEKLAAVVAHDDDPAYVDELDELVTLIGGAHPRWNGQQQQFFEVKEEEQ